MNQYKTCLITGGARGIGAATAERLSKKVDTIYLNYNTSQSQAESLCEKINKSGGRAIPIQADITDLKVVENMVNVVKQKHYRLDIFIHNASAPLLPKPILKLNWEEDVLLQMKVACVGFLNCIKCLNPLLQENSKVTAILTEALYHSPPVQMGAYLAAKGALLGLARSAAKEFQRKGVTLSIVSPSITDTDLLKNYDERALDFIAQDLPEGRLARPEEMAELIDGIIEGEDKYITMENVAMNGPIISN